VVIDAKKEAEPTPHLAVVWVIVDAFDRQDTPFTTARQSLVELGPAAVPALVEAYWGVRPDAGRESPPSSGGTHEERRRLLVTVLRDVPFGGVQAYIVRVCDKESSVESRVAALQLLAELGIPGAFGVALELLRDFDPIMLSVPMVAPTVHRTVLEGLESEVQSFVTLRRHWPALPRGVRAASITCLREVGTREMLGFLTEILGGCAEDDASILSELARLPLGSHLDSGQHARIVAFLEAESAAVRQSACRAVTHFRLRNAFPPLIDRLRDEDEGVRREALAALRALSGLRLEPDFEAWDSVWEEAERWAEDEGRRVAESISRGDARDISEALRSLVLHPLNHHLFTDPLLDLLDREEPALRVLACTGFAATRDPVAVPALIHAIEDPAPSVGVAALRALRSITNLSLPADRDQWNQALRLR
jgi:HEAT repeat protein